MVQGFVKLALFVTILASYAILLVHSEEVQRRFGLQRDGQSVEQNRRSVDGLNREDTFCESDSRDTRREVRDLHLRSIDENRREMRSVHLDDQRDSIVNRETKPISDAIESRREELRRNPGEERQVRDPEERSDRRAESRRLMNENRREEERSLERDSRRTGRTGDQVDRREERVIREKEERSTRDDEGRDDRRRLMELDSDRRQINRLRQDDRREGVERLTEHRSESVTIEGHLTNGKTEPELNQMRNVLGQLAASSLNTINNTKPAIVIPRRKRTKKVPF